MKKTTIKPVTRRQFLQKSGYLSIGFTLFGCMSNTSETGKDSGESFFLDQNPGPLADASQIDAWLQVLENGNIQILTGKMELGQGLTVVMQQVAGEELNIHPHKIRIILADTGLTQNEGYTAGSRSVERSAMTVRRAAASARELLIKMAADHLQVSQEQLTLLDGCIKRNDHKTCLTFADLLNGKQLSRDIPDQPSLKAKESYQWVGKPVPHPDLEKIVRGEALFIQDLKLPEMVHARVLHPPGYDAQLVSWDLEIAQMPGVLKVEENGSFLAVIAKEEYQALTALEALQQSTKWKSGRALPNVYSWSEYLHSQNQDVSTTPIKGSNSHHAVYSKPYLMHGSIGPSCAIAAFNNGQLQIWSHTQGVYPLRSTISHLTGLDETAIRISGVRGSGCYGHNGADDVAAEAALLAMAFPDRPVRLQWERSDEHLWEPYGSAMRMELSAKLGSNQKIEQWMYHLWSDGHSTRPRGDAGNFISARNLRQPFPFRSPARVGGGTRNSEPYYNIPVTEIKDHHVKGPLRTSALRSLGAYANIFAIESFMEELAEKAGLHPLEFRILHLNDIRAIEVINKLRSWVKNETAGGGEGIGFGFSRYKNTASYCAVAVKVKVHLTERSLSLVKMWAVLDAGEAINPDGLKNQTEGGMIQAASWTLKEEVQFTPDKIISRDWVSYPMIRFDQIPETAVMIVDRPDQPPLGAGESAQGPTAAAVANAVYSACGQRVRELPIEKTLFE